MPSPPKLLDDLPRVERLRLDAILPHQYARYARKLSIPTIYLPVYLPIPDSSRPAYPNTHPEAHPSTAAKRVLSLTNSHRSRHGARRLAMSKTLCAIARRHSEDQARRRKMSHRGGNGSSLSDRFRRGGYEFRYAAENVAAGQTSPEQVVNSWWHSRGHRRNILNQNVTEMGAWVVASRDGRCYWTQVFGRRR